MAEPIYGNTFAEDFAARRRMLPQAMGTAMPAQARGGYDPEAQLEELLRQRTALEQQQPDMGAMQAFARQQGEMGQGALLNALAAQYAGEGFQPLQTKLLRRAEAAQQPMKVGGGILTHNIPLLHHWVEGWHWGAATGFDLVLGVAAGALCLLAWNGLQAIRRKKT